MASHVDKINVSGDGRVRSQSAVVNGKRYGYLLGTPSTSPWRGTIFLIHGFPDLSMGWRYQMPMLMDMGLRVVAPDCLGYGRTDAPQDLALYSHKNCADDVKQLARQLGCSKIILGGHDWGAALAYRIALWHPDLVSHLFTVCVPYAAPTTKNVPLDEMVKGPTPHFAYQLQFMSGQLESAIHTTAEIRQFLLALYGGRTSKGLVAFAAEHGVFIDRLPDVRPSKLLTEEEVEYYTNEYSRNGIHGPLNWYRTRDINFRDELAIVGRQITCPVLFIQALRDTALPPRLGKGMARHIPQMSLKQVNTSHWALWEKPLEVNALICDWLTREVFVSGPLPKL